MRVQRFEPHSSTPNVGASGLEPLHMTCWYELTTGIRTHTLHPDLYAFGCHTAHMHVCVFVRTVTPEWDSNPDPPLQRPKAGRRSQVDVESRPSDFSFLRSPEPQPLPDVLREDPRPALLHGGAVSRGHEDLDGRDRHRSRGIHAVHELTGATTRNATFGRDAPVTDSADVFTPHTVFISRSPPTHPPRPQSGLKKGA